MKKINAFAVLCFVLSGMAFILCGGANAQGIRPAAPDPATKFLQIQSPKLISYSYWWSEMYPERPCYYQDPVFSLRLNPDSVQRYTQVQGQAFSLAKNKAGVAVRIGANRICRNCSQYYTDTIWSNDLLAGYTPPSDVCLYMDGQDPWPAGDTVYNIQFALLIYNEGQEAPVAKDAAAFEYSRFHVEPSVSVTPDLSGLSESKMELELTVQNAWPGYNEGNVWVKAEWKFNGQNVETELIRPVGENTGSFGFTNNRLESYNYVKEHVQTGEYEVKYTLIKVGRDSTDAGVWTHQDGTPIATVVVINTENITPAPPLTRHAPYVYTAPDEMSDPVVYYNGIKASLAIPEDKVMGREPGNYCVVMRIENSSLEIAPGSAQAAQQGSAQAAEPGSDPDGDLQARPAKDEAAKIFGDTVYYRKELLNYTCPWNGTLSAKKNCFMRFRVGLVNPDKSIELLGKDDAVVYRVITASGTPQLNYGDILKTEAGAYWSFDKPYSKDLVNGELGRSAGCTQVAMYIYNQDESYTWYDTARGGEDAYCAPRRIKHGEYKIKLTLLKVQDDGSLALWTDAGGNPLPVKEVKLTLNGTDPELGPELVMKGFKVNESDVYNAKPSVYFKENPARFEFEVEDAVLGENAWLRVETAAGLLDWEAGKYITSDTIKTAASGYTVPADFEKGVYYVRFTFLKYEDGTAHDRWYDVWGRNYARQFYFAVGIENENPVDGTAVEKPDENRSEWNRQVSVSGRNGGIAVNVPEAAVVEVFGYNGVLLNRQTVGAGVSNIPAPASGGLYLVRVSAAASSARIAGPAQIAVRKIFCK